MTTATIRLAPAASPAPPQGLRGPFAAALVGAIAPLLLGASDGAGQPLVELPAGTPWWVVLAFVTLSPTAAWAANRVRLILTRVRAAKQEARALANERRARQLLKDGDPANDREADQLLVDAAGQRAEVSVLRDEGQR